MKIAPMKVELIDYMGSDISVANAARVSMAKESEWGTIERYTYADQDFPDVEEVLKDKDVKLIDYLAKHAHWCYDDKTEVMTESGWKPFKDLLPTDTVAQVSGWDSEKWEMSFVTPGEVHCNHYSGPMYLCDSKTINYCVTPGHRMLVQNRTSAGYGQWHIDTSDSQFGRTKKMRTTAKLVSGAGGTYAEGWLFGFLLADGFRTTKSTVGVRLKRDRKIEALREVLKDTRTKFSERLASDGVTEFKITDSCTALDGATGKAIPEWVFGSSPDHRIGLLEGYMFGDGTTKHKAWAFSSSSRQLFDGICRLATLCGYQCSEMASRHLSNPKHNINYRGTVLSRDWGIVNPGQREDERVINYVGNVYCVTVPSGMLMVRREGVQVVCGNTPFSHPQLSFRIKAPIFVARQWFKHMIGITRNETSRRYVDEEPEFFMPEIWRGRPEGSIKQGSSGEVSHVFGMGATAFATLSVASALNTYKSMLDSGVAPEMARMILPQNMMTEWIETASLAAVCRACKLRLDPHAQAETREIAEQMAELVAPLFPVSWGALMA